MDSNLGLKRVLGGNWFTEAQSWSKVPMSLLLHQSQVGIRSLYIYFFFWKRTFQVSDYWKIVSVSLSLSVFLCLNFPMRHFSSSSHQFSVWSRQYLHSLRVFWYLSWTFGMNQSLFFLRHSPPLIQKERMVQRLAELLLWRVKPCLFFKAYTCMHVCTIYLSIYLCVCARTRACVCTHCVRVFQSRNLLQPRSADPVICLWSSNSHSEHLCLAFLPAKKKKTTWDTAGLKTARALTAVGFLRWHKQWHFQFPVYGVAQERPSCERKGERAQTVWVRKPGIN